MNTLIRLIGLMIIILFIPAHSCVPLMPTEIVAPPIVVEEKPIVPKVILITIDGVRWQEIFNGTDVLLYRGKNVSARELLPNLYSNFVDNGMVVGKDSSFIATGPAHISLPGYLEIMRGHPSTDCQTNECEPKLTVTMADHFDDVAVFASWDTIHKAVTKNITDKVVINCGRSYRSPAWKKAAVKEDKPFPEYFDPEYRPDTLTEEAALEYLQYYSPGFTWISLGDTDEWAHAGNYSKYLESLKQADTFIGQLLTMMRSIDHGRGYTVIVTADHGRSIWWTSHGWDKESARDWLMMAGNGIPVKGFVTYKDTKSLSNIYHTVIGILSKDPSDKSLLR